MGSKLADTYGMPFFEVSAKDGTNIEELFTTIGRDAYDKIKELGEKPVNNNVYLQSQEKTEAETGKGCGC